MYGYKPYVPVAQRRAQAARLVAKGRKDGAPLSPVVIPGRTIASSFWGKSWCDAMESYGDYANRLPRGRTYVRNGSVVDLRIEPGLVSASVSGSELYRTTVRVHPLSPADWRAVVDRHAAQVSSLVDLLQGKLPTSLLHALSDRSSRLFPRPEQLTFSCSCPDYASMCKHVAAVLYGVGARLDHDPGLFFLLRGVEVSDLAARGASVGFAATAGADDLGDVDLAGMFGIELAGEAPKGAPVVVVPKAAPAVVAPKAKAPKAVAPKPTAPEVTAPKVTAPKATAPKATAPKATAPKVTAPKATAPKVTAPKAPKPPRAPIAYAPLTAADLDRFGVDATTVTRWLRTGVLLKTAERGVYTPTDETGPHLRAYLAAR